MYGNKKILLLTLLFGVGFFILSAFKIFAQNTPGNYDVTVSPVFFDFSADPGNTINNKIKIRNNTTSPIPIKLGVEKLTGDLNGNLTLKQETNDLTLSWIKFQTNTVTLKPLEWTEIPFTIEIPKDGAYGYYWTITFKQDTSSPLARSGATVTGAAAVPILLNVRKPGAKMQGKVSTFKTDLSYYEYPPVKFLTTFENTGNVHIRPKGSIFIKDWVGRQIAVLEVNSGQGTVLPNSARIFESEWNDGFITWEPKLVDGQPKLDKKGKVERSAKIRFDKILDLRIGRYTATQLVVISTETRDVSFESETSFFVFPWKVVLGAIIFVVFAGIGFFNTFRNFVRRVMKIFGFGKKPKQTEETK